MWLSTLATSTWYLTESNVENYTETTSDKFRCKIGIVLLILKDEFPSEITREEKW